jgi:hypothetical protein
VEGLDEVCPPRVTSQDPRYLATDTRQTKDGSFLTVLVEEELLSRVSGSKDKPFEATYALTEKGHHAAEYGEYEYQVKTAVSHAPRSRARGAR